MKTGPQKMKDLGDGVLKDKQPYCVICRKPVQPGESVHCVVFHGLKNWAHVSCCEKGAKA